MVITPQQLKETNLIFIEHKKLLKSDSLLNCQLVNFKKSNQILIRTDSIRLKQLEDYEHLTNSYYNEITDLNHQIDKKNREILIWQIGGISVTIGLVIWLLVK